MSQFIVLEGITSTGKTTHGSMLVERMKSKGLNAFFNHEPTDHTPFGRLVRALIEKNECDPEDISRAERLTHAQTLSSLASIIQKIKRGETLDELERQTMYLADRHEDLRGTITLNMARGFTCVQDRYEMSTFAFGATKGLAYEELKTLQNKIVGEWYRMPDILLYFDLEPEVALRRLQESGKAIDIYETLPKMEKTRAAYKELIKKKELYSKIFVVDASRPMEDVFGAICQAVGI